ncbi:MULTISPECIES: DsbA family protein [Marivita]|uniref:DsbA family protein n=1 Tax=Marivita cryptomonadis TaxID=505252 RepID=A0A9Q2RZP2_9RHOB|nr:MULTISPECIES: DsbA family protein [Marivita]MCR9169438.1 DsbA family protein [Paracoccaceae bacterium]MBM2321692.1 DsbA family protein [Marivita cryptomonadis]MBM2331273.1 DsbA family protein [Marivita cryptomonadis]MBM2340859.1 DsbA family protein [Marivita cryptomonadis]MBM2345521.1 DsbA family protein [Marivita cryptomonadis]
MKQRLMTIALATALVAGAGWWVAGTTGQAPTINGQAIALPGAANAQESAAADVTIQEMVLGAEDAPVEIIEYASFTCPHCATFHKGVFKDLKADYIDTGKVKFTYREVYFDRYGLWGSLVARCGGEDRFFGITEMIYDTQGEWSRAGSEAAIADELRKIGRIAGLENDQLEACLSNGDKARGLIEWYQANAEEHGISSTPSFVINGTTYSNMSYGEFQEIIDEKVGG